MESRIFKTRKQTSFSIEDNLLRDIADAYKQKMTRVSEGLNTNNSTSIQHLH